MNGASNLAARPPSTVIVAALVGAVIAGGVTAVLVPWRARGEALERGGHHAEQVDVEIEADAPAAALTLRGRTSPLPFREQVAASDIPEAIEITAPGHEGRRFWLKLDRPRSLRVVLPSGSGLLDATYEETQVALGDRAAPAPFRLPSPDDPAERLVRSRDTRPAPPPTGVPVFPPPSPPPAALPGFVPVEAIRGGTDQHGRPRQTLDRGDPWR